MNQSLPMNAVLIATVLSGLIILLTRTLPFLIFSKREPPAVIRFIEKYSPALIMTILFVYCLKDVNFTAAPFGIDYLICIAVVAVLHLTVKNSMVSIFGGTALYIILNHLMPLFIA